MDSNSSIFEIGSSTNQGFQGFITYSLVKNSNICYSKDLPANNCLFNQYLSGTCRNCSESTYPFCIGLYSSLCHSANCTSCDGYYSDSCKTCRDPSLELCILGKNCASGSGFNCTVCMTGFCFISGLCLNPPSPFVSLTLDFDTFGQFKGEIFQSGSDPLTYSPFNNPDPDDPVALSQRGFSFNKNQFMAAKNITLNFSFTVTLWAKAGSLYVALCDKMSLMYDSSLVLCLPNYEVGRKEVLIFKCLPDNWKFFGVIVDFYGNSTHFSSVCWDSITKTRSVPGLAFYDNPGDLILLLILIILILFIG